MFTFLDQPANTFIKEIINNTKINLELHIIDYHRGYESVKGLIKEHLDISDKDYEVLIQHVEKELGVYDVEV